MQLHPSYMRYFFERLGPAYACRSITPGLQRARGIRPHWLYHRAEDTTPVSSTS